MSNLEFNLVNLLCSFKNDTHNYLKLIHEDPLITKRYLITKNNKCLFIANASKALFTPTESHQQLAKGVVYTINNGTYELVSMPLTKIWNYSEHTDAQYNEISKYFNNSSYMFSLSDKEDGTLISRFVFDNQVYFATRGVIQGCEDVESEYIDEAIRVANEKYPLLLSPDFYSNLTLNFELIFPEGRVVRNYGDRRDLIFISVFDLDEYVYDNDLLSEITSNYKFNKALTIGFECDSSFTNEVDSCLKQLKGTDHEGFILSVVHINDQQVIYRVKFKSEDYLRLSRALNYCSYKHVAELVFNDPELESWSAFLAYLYSIGADDMPKELLEEYKQHHDDYLKFKLDLYELVSYAYIDYMNICNKLGIDKYKENRDPLDDAKIRKDFYMSITNKGKTSLIMKFFSGIDMGDMYNSLYQQSKGRKEFLEKFV